MRLFIGVKLDLNTIKKVKRLLEYLYQSNYKGKFQDINNIHLTLAFLGEVNENRIPTLKSILNDIDISNLNKLIIKKLTKLNDIIILECEKSKELLDVYNRLYNELEKDNFIINKKDNREYYPHITLVRECKENILDKNFNIESIVDRIVLFESTRDSKGKLLYIEK